MASVRRVMGQGEGGVPCKAGLDECGCAELSCRALLLSLLALHGQAPIFP